MSTNIHEWKEILNEKFPEWDIHINQDRIFISVPDTIDFEVLKTQFPDMIIILNPFLTHDTPQLEFTVDNSVESFQYVLRNKRDA